MHFLEDTHRPVYFVFLSIYRMCDPILIVIDYRGGGGGGTAMKICGGFKYDVHNEKNYEWQIVEGGNNISRTQTVIFAHLSACNKSLE